jgi:gliding motility-associated lipoprotein GldB
MNKLLSGMLFTLVFISCDKKTKIETAVEEIPLEIKVERFDKAFFETPITDLAKTKKQFPSFYPKEIQDSVWINKMKNPLWRELYTEVQKKFGNFAPQKAELEETFRHIKYYFPKTKTPKVYTLIYEVDANTKTIYADSIVLISLEMYLGKNHKFYDYPAYQRQNFEPSQIMPDLISSFADSKIIYPKEKTLLSKMIYEGKKLYLKDILLPDFSDADKIGYLPAQIEFCNNNESFIWQYFIENKMLFSTDSNLNNRFINPAPFSKFYLEVDNETPGRIGIWIGWQIVRSYMENNKVSVTDLLKTDAETIFNKSKYKPKKV